MLVHLKDQIQNDLTIYNHNQKKLLDTKLNEDKLLEQLTNVGLEVESVENLSAGLDLFKVAKILKTIKCDFHRLKPL